MSVKFSEMTALRIDLARNLEAGFDTYLESIAGGYGAFVTPLLEEGQTAPDIRPHLELLKRGVAHRRERLEGLDDGVVGQSHEDAKVRAELDLRLDAVDGKLRLVRHVCRGIFGSDGVARAGLREEPPRGAWRLYEHGKTVQESLENPDLGLKPLIELDLGEGAEPPQAQLADQLEPELTELGELVGDRHQENRKGDDVRSRWRREIHDFDHDVRAIVRTTQGILRLAGRDDLAERFRPILRRSLRRIKKAEAEEAAEEQSAAAEAAATETETENGPTAPAETATTVETSD